MSPRTSRGFTLVELLVVIGIIALLISILLPSLQKARESAVRVQCLSNMRQTLIAITAYAADNKGWYPPGTFDDYRARDWTWPAVEPLPMRPARAGLQSARDAQDVAKYGKWGNIYAAEQFLDNHNVNSLSAFRLAKYMGGDPTQNGNHYLAMLCPVIWENSPKYRDYYGVDWPANHSFHYGMPSRSGNVAPRQGRVKEENLQMASTDPAYVITPPGYVPVRFLFTCSTLTLFDNITGRYGGFMNRHGQHGNVHGTRQKYMNVMTLNGATYVVRERLGFAAVAE